MSSLAPIRRDLSALRRRRRLIRWGTALAGISTGTVWLLAAAFVLDFSLLLSLPWRAFLLLSVLAGLAVAWRSLVRPWLGHHESELDLALLVQRQQRRSAAAAGDTVLGLAATPQGILARDLVAALQFESPAAGEWGSVQLERLVVDDVSALSRGLNVFEGMPLKTLARRSALLVATLAAFGFVVARWPDHAWAFARRMMLQGDHYPSATQLVKLSINGRDVPLADGVRPASAPAAEGQPLQLFVDAAGALPPVGRLELTTTTGRKVMLDLKRTESVASVSAATASYTARLDRLNERLSYQLFLGDAWTDPAAIELIELPVVDCMLTPTPPDYAAAKKSRPDTTGLRNLEALEGSRVAVKIECKNKPLARVTLLIDDRPFALRPLDEGGRQWQLDPANTPLASLIAETKYRVETVDVDGLAPEHRVEGTIRILPDRPPRVAAIVKTRHVVPEGSPVIEYRAVDDYGLAKITIKGAVVREGPDGSRRTPLSDVPLVAGPMPLVGDQLPVDAKQSLNLAHFALTKGDRLELIVEAVDFRGPAPGKAAQTEPIILNVTDAEGVASAVTELDPALEQQFDALIQRQLDIGATR